MLWAGVRLGISKRCPAGPKHSWAKIGAPASVSPSVHWTRQDPAGGGDWLAVLESIRGSSPSRATATPGTGTRWSVCKPGPRLLPRTGLQPVKARGHHWAQCSLSGHTRAEGGKGRLAQLGHPHTQWRVASGTRTLATRHRNQTPGPSLQFLKQ